MFVLSLYVIRLNWKRGFGGCDRLGGLGRLTDSANLTDLTDSVDSTDSADLADSTHSADSADQRISRIQRIRRIAWAIFKRFLSFNYSATKGFISFSKLPSELYFAEG